MSSPASQSSTTRWRAATASGAIERQPVAGVVLAGLGGPARPGVGGDDRGVERGAGVVDAALGGE